MNLTWRFGMCLYRDGRYNEAEVSFMEVAEKQKKVLGEEHPSTLTSMANLASTFWNQGRWKEAEAVCASDGDEKEGVRRGESRHAD
jgi:Tetratricopeptide repeat